MHPVDLISLVTEFSDLSNQSQWDAKILEHFEAVTNQSLFLD